MYLPNTRTYIKKWKNHLYMNNNKLFIEWAEYASRADSLANAVGAKTIFIGKVNKYKNLLYSFSSYPAKVIENFKVIKKEKPQVVYITNTNWIIAFVNIIFSKIFGHKLIFDSHSCAFDHEFIKYPLPLSKIFARFADLSIVTNESHYNLLKSNNAKAIIISDIPFEESLVTDEKISLSDKFNILFICTFAPDEPYLEVFEAAKKNLNVHIYVTGQYSRVNINPSDHPQVTLTGFLSNEDYRKYLNNVDAVMTLTTREDTMQRAGSESISVEKPLITSSTKMLRDYFSKGAVFVDNTSVGILNGFTKVIENYDSLKNGIELLKENRKKVFHEKLVKLKTIEEK